jgi:hypothetical protein
MMKLPPLEYTIDNIVLGWRAQAISFAREQGYHLIVNSDQRPFHHFRGHQDIKSRWYEDIFNLGMRSLLPVPFNVETVGIEDGKLKVITQGATKVLINFKTLHVFDLDNIGIIGVEQIVEDYTVHDMFDIVQGSRLGQDMLLTHEDNLLQTVRFVPSNRIDRNTAGDFKDIIATSIISEKDIKSFDYSETIIRILLERRLKEHKIYQPNGRSLKLQHSFRHTTKNKFSFNVVADLDERIVLHV